MESYETLSSWNKKEHESSNVWYTYTIKLKLWYGDSIVTSIKPDQKTRDWVSSTLKIVYHSILRKYERKKHKFGFLETSAQL